MRIDNISKKVDEIKQKYNTSSIPEICDQMNIMVFESYMGSSQEACKGFCFKAFNVMTITVNSGLSDQIKRVILAHELGHAVLHCDETTNSVFNDIAVFDRSSVLEYEANLFAAEFLIEDSIILDLLMDGYSLYDAAAELSVPPELMDFKMRAMKKKGYNIDIPYIADSTFLRNIAT